MKYIPILLLLIACGTPSTEPNTKKYTTELACGLDAESVQHFSCSSSKLAGDKVRVCNGPTARLIIENPGYYCSGNEFSVSEIETDDAYQWEFPVGVQTPEVRWSDGKIYVPRPYFPVHTTLIPFFFWYQKP